MRALLLLLLAAASDARACAPFSEPDGAGGCVVCDCGGACYSASTLKNWPADGRCDDAAPDFDCDAFERGGGDCTSQIRVGPPPPPHIALHENVFAPNIVAIDIV